LLENYKKKRMYDNYRKLKDKKMNFAQMQDGRQAASFLTKRRGYKSFSL
jgi:hypothetical protein